MTLVVRDEIDVVPAQLAYHLNAGVDFVLATDNGSTDGTLEVLEAYERAGVLRLIRETGQFSDGPWRTRMARLAATEHGADWVINTDADEFWMPRRGTLRDAFAAVPPSIGVIWAVSRHFVPQADDGRPFDERMLARFSSAAALNDPTSPYRPHGKAAHRADPAIVVNYGAHRVRTRLAPLPHWHPADVLHFPYRSLEQYERKTVRRAHSDSHIAQYVLGLRATRAGPDRRRLPRDGRRRRRARAGRGERLARRGHAAPRRAPAAPRARSGRGDRAATAFGSRASRRLPSRRARPATTP